MNLTYCILSFQHPFHGKKIRVRWEHPTCSWCFPRLRDSRKLPSWNVALMEARRWYHLTTEGSSWKKIRPTKRSAKTRVWGGFWNGSQNCEEEGLREKPTHSGFLKWSVGESFWRYLFFFWVWVSRIMKMFIGTIKVVLGGFNWGLRCYIKSRVTYCPDYSMSNWVLVTSKYFYFHPQRGWFNPPTIANDGWSTASRDGWQSEFSNPDQAVFGQACPAWYVNYRGMD